MALLLDQRPHLLDHHGKEPGQQDFEPDRIVHDLKIAACRLAEDRDAEVGAVVCPGVLDAADLAVGLLLELAEPALETADRLLLAELVGDRDDERLRHEGLRNNAPGIWGRDGEFLWRARRLLDGAPRAEREQPAERAGH